MAAPTRPARKPRPKPKPIVLDDEEFVPLQHTSTDEPVEEERVTIAYLDEQPITMPAHMPPNVALKVMRTSRRRGDEVAMAEMLEEVIGPDSYERLANFRGLTDDNLVDLMTVVTKVAMGALEVPKAGSRNGSGRSAG